MSKLDKRRVRETKRGSKYKYIVVDNKKYAIGCTEYTGDTHMIIQIDNNGEFVVIKNNKYYLVY